MRIWTTIKIFQEILFDFHEGIARITINRPRYRNAFTPLTVSEMSQAFAICREDPRISVVVLTGAHSHLALVGSRTGALDDAFSRIAEECRAEADRAAASAIALIEPTLVAVLSVLVGVVLLSVLAPMLGLLSAM